MKVHYLSPTSGTYRLLVCLLLATAPLLTIPKPIRGQAARPQADITISGRVTDAATNEALAGCTVVLKGTQRGTTTDANGAYSIVVPDANAKLVFGFIGFNQQEIAVSNKTAINISLTPSASDLAQVVVVGYGSTAKKDITGAVTSIKSSEFNQGVINSPEQLIQGKVAGVNVTSASGEPGAQQRITVRGPGGVRTGSTPLFVLDGLALDNSSTGGATNPLTFLNPQDIESIDVLKDASATAIYGSRGANGVILITTKKGKSGTPTLNASVSLGISNLSRPLNVFSADEYQQPTPTHRQLGGRHGAGQSGQFGGRGYFGQPHLPGLRCQWQPISHAGRHQPAYYTGVAERRNHHHPHHCQRNAFVQNHRRAGL